MDWASMSFLQKLRSNTIGQGSGASRQAMIAATGWLEEFAACLLHARQAALAQYA
jgi:hypothetical protein